ncbi:MAG: HPr family phosphocarrier protein [Candidatus Dormibacteraeota bacterium]|nr:HPr family phosphocarrier protein [Candidatus Dormibacteraeota bacterium]
MPEISLKVDNDVGLHARPAALFVQTAARFQDTTIEVRNGTATCDAKSILQLLTLGVGPGTVITVRAEGGQADEALDALRNLVEGGFSEG